MATSVWISVSSSERIGSVAVASTNDGIDQASMVRISASSSHVALCIVRGQFALCPDVSNVSIEIHDAAVTPPAFDT